MTTYLGKNCSFRFPRVPFVNCRQFMYLVISLLVLRAGCGIWLYQFLIIAYLFTLQIVPFCAAPDVCFQYWTAFKTLAQRISVIISEWLVNVVSDSQTVMHTKSSRKKSAMVYGIARGEIVNSIASSGIIGMIFPQNTQSYLLFRDRAGPNQSLP